MSNSKWPYEHLIEKLRKYSFSSKMTLAHYHSRNLLAQAAQDINIRRLLPLNDSIETFVMLSVRNNEWELREMSEREFQKIVRKIPAFHHPKLDELSIMSPGNWLVSLVSSTQFYLQANERYRIARCFYYFTYHDDNIDMREVFYNKFGLSYEDLIGPICCLWLWECPDSGLAQQLPPDFFSWIYREYPKAINLLVITRDDYKKELDNITKDPLDYLFCLRPSYTYPFIEYNGKIYNPTPHLLIRAATVSLMFRLTKDDNELREKIGKFVLEPYLFKLVSKCGKFAEVLPEQKYGKDLRTADVMACSTDDIVCFDSKSFTPQVAFRTFSLDAVLRGVEIIAGYVKQIYKQIYNEYGRNYNFLSTPIDESRSNIFGIVVLQENPYFPLESIYKKAAELLNISVSSAEYDWMCGHIGIVDIDILERELLDCENLADDLRTNINTGRYYDNWFLNTPVKKNYSLPAFVDDSINKVFMRLKENL